MATSSSATPNSRRIWLHVKIAVLLILTLGSSYRAAGMSIQWILQAQASIVETSALVLGGSTEKSSSSPIIISPLHDKTLAWDPSVKRLWLDPNLTPEERPPAMLLLQNSGWNQPDQQKGLAIQRHRRETLLFTAVINHPWFHPTFYEDIEQSNLTTIPNDVRFYVFIDIYQYRDSHWPLYNRPEANLDSRFNRSVLHFTNAHRISFRNVEYHCSLGRLFSEGHNVTTILFDASPDGPPSQMGRSNGSLSSLPISLISLSALISNVNDDLDQGLIPPAIHPVNMTKAQIRDIETCDAEKNRPLFFVFLGNSRSGGHREFHMYHTSAEQPVFGARRSYFSIHDDEHIFAFHPEKEKHLSKLVNLSYSEILSQTVFGLASRGDQKYSYRFAEVLSAGAIPVVHADDWVWPFRPELIDWNECAVILPEKDAGNKTIQILESISIEQRCKMRQKCWNIYKTYAETAEGTINGIIEGLELVATNGEPAQKLLGVRCDNYTNPMDCNMK